MGTSELYLVPSKCERSRPSGGDSLVDLYGLRGFANSVARQDPETGAKRKLRKSYKNHVADLPGKHPVPTLGESAWQLMDSAMRPPPGSVEDVLRVLDFDKQSLARLKFQKGAGLPGFDPKLLAAPGPAAQGDPSSPQVGSPSMSPHEDRKEKRRRKETVGGEKRRKI